MQMIRISIFILFWSRDQFIVGDRLDPSLALDGFKTPCYARKSTDQNFQTACAIDYLQKPYVCDPDHSFSRTEIDRIDREVIKPAKFFSYCPCFGQRCKNAMLIESDDIDRSRRRRNGNRGRGPLVLDGYDQIGKTNAVIKPISISINVYKKLIWPRTRGLVSHFSDWFGFENPCLIIFR